MLRLWTEDGQFRWNKQQHAATKREAEHSQLKPNQILASEFAFKTNQ